MKINTYHHFYQFHGRIKPTVSRARTATPLRASATLSPDELRQAVYEVLG